MPVTATKTYNQMISDDPSIEAGLLYAGYPSTTVQGIRDWFGTRNVCDDDNFKNFFLRLANPLAPKYLAQLRMETVDKNFDPLVENYLERYTENGGEDTHKPAGFSVDKHPIEYTKLTKPADVYVSDSPAETTKTIKPALTEITERPAGYKDTKTPVPYTDTINEGTHTTKTGSIGRSGSNSSGTNTSRDIKEASKQLPMNTGSGEISSGTIGDGVSGISGMTWGTASSKGESSTKENINTSGSDSSTETYNSVKETKGGSDEIKRTYTGNEILEREYNSDGYRKTSLKTNGEGKEEFEVNNAGVKETKYGNAITGGIDKNNEALGVEKMIMDYMGSETTRYSNDEKNTYGRTYKERYTGRAGLTPQQALTEAITYLRTISPAFFDLMMKLEPAFLGVYDV